ncbi:unnamed protein product [Prunus armeniaca]
MATSDNCRLPTADVSGVTGTPFYDPSDTVRSWKYLDQPTRTRLQSNGSNVSNPEIAQYARSVRGSNVIRIDIREFLRARDYKRVTRGPNASLLQCPRAATSAGSVWLPEVITLRQKISTYRLKTLILGKTPNLEPLLFLDLPQKLAGSGRNC